MAGGDERGNVSTPFHPHRGAGYAESLQPEIPANRFPPLHAQSERMGQLHCAKGPSLGPRSMSLGRIRRILPDWPEELWEQKLSQEASLSGHLHHRSRLLNAP